jgi:hypothetical protein
MIVNTDEARTKKSDSPANSTARGMQKNGIASKKELTQIAMSALTSAALSRSGLEM